MRQVVFRDDAARYLMLQQDIILPALPHQQAHLMLPAPAIVYDLRAGKRIGMGKVREWDVTLSRERPLIFSLMPHEVTGVAVQAGTATRGETRPVQVAVSVAGGDPGYHVVRLNVYAPGGNTPHRQYSQNIGCDGGKGSGSIPFALSDPTANALPERVARMGVETASIYRCNPWGGPYRFISATDEPLDRKSIGVPLEAQVVVERWRRHHKH